MTISIANVSIANDNFGDWVTRTNLIADAMTNYVVTVDSNATVGNAVITGSFQTDNLYADILSGGAIGSKGLLTFDTNTTFSGTTTTISGNFISNSSNIFLGIAANVQITGANATHDILKANSTTNKLYFGQISTSSISDFNISGVANGEVIYYDNATSMWVNIDPSSLDGIVSPAIQIISGLGLTGGANLASDVTLNVGAGNGIAVDADSLRVVAGNSQLVSNSSGVWLIQSGINHNSLNNYNANQHIDHTSIIVSGGTGLAGSGDLTSNVELTINVNSLSTNSTPTQATTYVPAWNGTSHVKVPLAKIGIGKQHEFVHARYMEPRFTNGPSLGFLETANNFVQAATIDFDPTTTEYAQFSWIMPDNWNEGTLTAKFGWSHGNTATNFGVSWGIRAVALADGDDLDSAFGANAVVSDLGSASYDKYLLTAESPSFTVAGSPTAGELVTFEIFRQTANTNDNMTVNARLHGIKLYMTTDNNIGG